MYQLVSNHCLDLNSFESSRVFPRKKRKEEIQKEASNQLIPIFENILRLILFILFFVRGNYKNYIIRNLFIIYIVIEIIWSSGTANWGTAIRHHVPSWGLLIVCCLYNRYNIKKL